MFKPPRPPDDGQSGPSRRTRLEICTSCDSDYVHPVEWIEADDKHWWMLLRCGECRAEREVTVADPVARRFDQDLDAAGRQIARAAARLDAERMAAEIEVFAAALERDLIGPSDFHRNQGRNHGTNSSR